MAVQAPSKTDFERWKGGRMHTMNTFPLMCALAAPAFASAASASDAQGEQSVLEECGAYSQAGMRDCLAKKAHDSEAALKQAEDKAADRLAKWDEDTKHVAAAMKRFAASGKAFSQYRDMQCAFAASLGGGAIGNALELRRLACIAELNTMRAEQLSRAANALPLH